VSDTQIVDSGELMTTDEGEISKELSSKSKRLTERAEAKI
jgi:hypothetical protein